MQATKAHQDALREAARLRAALRAVVESGPASLRTPARPWKVSNER